MPGAGSMSRAGLGFPPNRRAMSPAMASLLRSSAGSLQLGQPSLQRLDLVLRRRADIDSLENRFGPQGRDVGVKLILLPLVDRGVLDQGVKDILQCHVSPPVPA